MDVYGFAPDLELVGFVQDVKLAVFGPDLDTRRKEKSNKQKRIVPVAPTV